MEVGGGKDASSWSWLAMLSASSESIAEGQKWWLYLLLVGDPRSNGSDNTESICDEQDARACVCV